MDDKAYYFSWFLYYMFWQCVLAFIVTFLMWTSMVQKSSFILLFLFFIQYGITIFGFATLSILLFSSEKTGVSGGALIHFGTLYLKYLIPQNYGFMINLIPNISIAKGCYSLWKLEEYGYGLQFGTIFNRTGSTSIFIYFISQFSSQVILASLCVLVYKI